MKQQKNAESQTPVAHNGHLPLRLHMGREDAIPALMPTPLSALETVGGVGCVGGLLKEKSGRFVWRVERGARHNYQLLGERLAESGDLYRNRSDGQGLIQILPAGETRHIRRGPDLSPVIADRLRMQVVKEGKVVRELPTTEHLHAMLKTEAFLGQFRPVDVVTRLPFYLEDFCLAKPGYNEGGPGQRILYVGPEPTIADSTEAIETFLRVMDFAGTTDRTNAVGAALTVLLRHLWLGQKPLILVTASKSHSGKGTITDFVRGAVHKADLLYESVDWPMQHQFQRQVQHDPDLGVILLDNVRLDSAGGRGKFIRSAFIESFVTEGDVTLASPGAGEPVRIKNQYIVIINTNEGTLSIDLLNRALTIHLCPRGNVHDRQSPIGNPKLEYLPKNCDRIGAELRGMIERWKAVGRPLDGTVKHPMTPWARTISGILKVSGFEGFLGNYGTQKIVANPIQEALSILGGARPGKALRCRVWARIAMEQGLGNDLFKPGERASEKGRERAIGVLFKKYREETFMAQTNHKRFVLRLEGGQRRWPGDKNPGVRYLFTVEKEEEMPLDEK